MLSYFHTMAAKRYDILWKGMLEDIFIDMLRFIYKDADEIFDFEKGVIFLDTELAELFPGYELKDAVRIDKLALLHLKKGGRQLFYVHTEVEGGHRKGFNERMYNYFRRLGDKFGKPILSLAILTGPFKSYHPKKYIHEFLGTRIEFTFNTLKITDYAGREEELYQCNNPFAMVILTALLWLKKGKVLEHNLLAMKIDLARKLFEKKFSKQKIERLYNFLQTYIVFDKQEMNIKFDEITKSKATVMGVTEMIKEIFTEEGLQKGLLKGLQKGQTIFVGNLIKETDFSDKKIARLANVTIAFVKKIRNAQ